jgi:hypothetical protein
VNTTTPLPCDVLLCPRTRDVILIPRGMLCIRLTPDQQQALIEQLRAVPHQHQP